MEYQPIQTNEMPFHQKLKNLLWGIVNSTLFRFTPPYFVIFRKLRVYILKLFGASLEWNVSVHPKSKIEYPWNLTMKSMSSIGENSWIYAMAPITIGENTCIGKDTYLLTGTHNIQSNRFELITKPITIGNGCWIATRTTVLPGCNIGDFVVVAANSTVTKDVKTCDVVGGNPAKFIKKRDIKNA